MEEKVLYDIKPHIGIILFVLPVAITTFIFSLIVKAPLAFILFGLITGVFSLYIYGRRGAARLIISDERVYIRKGLFKVTKQMFLRNQIKSAEIVPAFWGNTMGWAHLKISDNNGIIILKYILGAEEICSELNGEKYEPLMNSVSKKNENLGQIEEKRAVKMQQKIIHESKDTFQRNISASNMLIRKCSEKPLWKKGCPILIKEYRIVERESDKTLYISIDVQNLSTENITAVYFEIYGFNVLKEEKAHIKEAVWLDLDICCGECVTLEDYELEDTTIRNIKILPRHVVYKNEDIWSDSEENGFIKLDEKSEEIQSGLKDAVCRISMEKTLHHYDGKDYKFYPVKKNDYWICSCGQMNTSTVCVLCGEDEDIILSNFSRDKLIQNQEKYEKRQLEELEKRRKEEEENRRKQADAERQRQEQLAKEKEARAVVRQQQMKEIKRKTSELVTKVGEKTVQAGSKIVAASENIAKQNAEKNAIKKADGESKNNEQPQTMYCGNCGNKLRNGDMFCGECGWKI